MFLKGLTNMVFVFFFIYYFHHCNDGNPDLRSEIHDPPIFSLNQDPKDATLRIRDLESADFILADCHHWC